jgi:Concanavalin A-like lectin/glucanases superfamily
MKRIVLPILAACLAALACPTVASAQDKVFRAGAAAVDIAPEHFPVIVNGGFLAARAAKLNDPIRAKCLVLDDGSTRLAIVVVDSCMMPRELIDRAKAIAAEKTGIPADRMLISATHTHSAPSVMGALGTPPDVGYAASLPARIAAAIERAAANLEPARAGWVAVDDHEHTFCRRWIRRPDRMIDDPFGVRKVRANMHPGYQNPDAIAPSGPVDPALTVLSIQSTAGRPIAVLANYSMHYYGAEPVSADYYGRFADALARRIGAEPKPGSTTPPFVAMMSQGTSGDQMWMDYGQPKKDPGLDAYADAVAASAERAYRSVAYRTDVPLAVVETTLVLGRRLPDEARLAWARGVIAGMKDRDAPRTLPEVYAREAVFLHDEPSRELKLQAIRIGPLGITAIPNEVFAITGLKLKMQSPFDLTMNIELANGSEGYIPPPEQHALGGYTTWPARTAGLEVQAEPKIVAAVLQLLEQVAGRPRRAIQVPKSPYAEAVLASKPMAYWRLDDIEGAAAIDSGGRSRQGTFEGGFALFLPGPVAPGLTTPGRINRAVYLAGGRLKTTLDRLPPTNAIELWFWNSGGPESRGQLKTTPRIWHHLVRTRGPRNLKVYLDGVLGAEMIGDNSGDADWALEWLSLAGRSGEGPGFEGLIDEVAIYDRALEPAEIAAHLRAAGQR